MSDALTLTPLWSPTADYKVNSNLKKFAKTIEQRYGQQFDLDYRKLHQWSINEPECFWSEIIRQFGIPYDGDIEPAMETLDVPPFAKWFPRLRLNYAESMLRWPGDWTAVIEAGEEGEGRHWSFAELRERVRQHQAGLRAAGINEGDCVAGILPNTAESLAAMLAAASIGAIWASVSPDFGVAAALDRLGQVKPKLLYAVGSYRFAGKVYDTINNVLEICKQMPTVHKVVCIGEEWLESCRHCNAVVLQDFLGKESDEPLEFVRLPFSHPLFILFTSGTTGAPKCIVHSHGGPLLQLMKEHQLHCELKNRDRTVFPSTLGWMMWNWSVTALASGACVVLYEGSLMAPDESAIFRLADKLNINVLGLPSAFIERCRQQNVTVETDRSLKGLRLLFAGGSVLSPEGFDYVYKNIAPDVHLTTGSGGTDIVSCFMLGNAWQPVWAGQMQGPALGMDVKVFDEEGEAVIGEQGELVCCAPAPSMPVSFVDDPEYTLFLNAYFSHFPDVWTHGDFAEETSQGGFIIHGRSDSVLNPGGVRIGTAEIYRQVQTINEVVESVVVGQQVDNDVRIVLFVVMKEGKQLDEMLCQKIRRLLRTNASPRHVPKLILEVPDIPKTRSGKIAETAVAAVINGREPRQLHALSNSESIDYFRNIPELKAV